jgi:hypothetical protein
MNAFHFLEHDQAAVGYCVPREFRPCSLRPSLDGVD